VQSLSDLSDLSEEERQVKVKKQNKIRAKKSRERKKKYTEHLEQRVNLLEKQVKYLTLELDKYQKRDNTHELNHEEEKDPEISLLKQALDKLHKSTNVKKFNNTFASIRKQTGVKGVKRIHILNKAFDVIVDYLIPDNLYSALYKVSISKSKKPYVDIQRVKKLQKLSKYQIQEMFENKEINDKDKHWYDMQLTAEQAKVYNSQYHLLVKGRKNYKDIIKRLCQMRQDMFKNAEMLDKYAPPIITKLKYNQLVTQFENSAKWKSEGLFSLDTLFGFKKTESSFLKPANRKHLTEDCILDQYEILNHS